MFSNVILKIETPLYSILSVYIYNFLRHFLLFSNIFCSPHGVKKGWCYVSISSKLCFLLNKIPALFLRRYFGYFDTVTPA